MKFQSRSESTPRAVRASSIILRLLLAALGLLLIVYLLPSWRATGPLRRTHIAMGTLVTFTLYGDRDASLRALELGTTEIDRIEAVMSNYSKTSELAKVESLAAIRATVCSTDLGFVLRRSQEWSKASVGAFDITVGAFSRLWSFGEAWAVPNSVNLRAALPSVDYNLVRMTGDTLRLLRPGMSLDLGAVAKGYAVDRVAAVLRNEDVRSGLIEAGGDVRFWGEKPDGSRWRLGIQHPRRRDQIIEVGDIGFNALATSGDYEQFFEQDGQRFHHILDPRTGYPARESVSATVWTDNAMDADILSTAAFVMGPDAAMAWIESLPRAEALLFFERDGQLRHRYTSGVTGHLQIAQP